MINCGTDIVKISRLEKALETPGFYEKVFGKRERAEFEKRGARLESLAAAFAAKEAFGKRRTVSFSVRKSKSRIG